MLNIPYIQLKTTKDRGHTFFDFLQNIWVGPGAW